MRLPLSIALRYLFVARKNRSVFLFSSVAILGILSSVLLFLLIDSVISGLAVQLKDTLIGFEAPATIETKSQDHANVLKAIQSKEGVISIPVKQFEGLMKSVGQAPTSAKIRSVSNEFIDLKKNELEIFWINDFTKEEFLKRDDVILLGEKLYERLYVYPADEEYVSVTHPFADLGPSGDLEPMQKHFQIAGLFHSGRFDFDDGYAMVSNLGMSSMANPLFLEHRIFLYDRLNGDILNKLIPDWNKTSDHKIETWLDKNKRLFRALQLEKLLYFMIMIFVMVIAGFNLAGVISIFCLGRTKDVAVFQAIGFSLKQIRRIFLSLGFLFGLMGGIGGVVLGIAIVVALKVSGFKMPEAYGFTELPLILNHWTLLALLIGTPLLTTLISAYPAYRFTKPSVMELMRG